MPAHKRTKAQRESDLARIAELHADGQSQREIADLIGVSQVQICKDLKEIYQRWAEPDPKRLAVTKGRMLAEIGVNKKIMKQAWRDSLKPKETVSKKQVSTPGDVVGAGEDPQQRSDRERNEASLKTEDRDGNVAFMREVREYIAMEIKLHGLNAADSAVSDGDHQPIRIIEIRCPTSVPPPDRVPVAVPQSESDSTDGPRISARSGGLRFPS